MTSGNEEWSYPLLERPERLPYCWDFDTMVEMLRYTDLIFPYEKGLVTEVSQWTVWQHLWRVRRLQQEYADLYHKKDSTYRYYKIIGDITDEEWEEHCELVNRQMKEFVDNQYKECWWFIDIHEGRGSDWRQDDDREGRIHWIGDDRMTRN